VLAGDSRSQWWSWTSVQYRRSTSSQAQAELIGHLAQALPVGLLTDARSVAGRIRSEEDRAQALTALLPRVTRSVATELARDALQAVEEVRDVRDQVQALGRLAPFLPGSALRRAIDIASAIPESLPRAMALAALLLRLESDERIADALLAAIREALSSKATRPAFPALRNLEPVQDFATRRRHDAQAAYLFPRGWVKPLDRLTALLSCAARLPGSHQRAAIRMLLWTARNIYYVEERVQALCRVSTYLPPRDRQRVLADSLKMAHGLADAFAKAFALVQVGPYREEPDRTNVVQLAIEATSHVEDPESRAELLLLLAEHVPARMVESFLAEARRIDSERARASVFAGLSASPGGCQTQIVLSEAEAMRDPVARAHALTAISVSVPQGAQGRVLEGALDALRGIGDVPLFLDLAKALHHQLLTASGALRVRGLLETMAKLSGQPRERWLEHSLRLMPLLNAQGGSPAIDEFAAAVGDTGRWWP
jgi:hypothetical protein